MGMPFSSESISGGGFGSSMRSRGLQAAPPSPSLPDWPDPLRARESKIHRSCPFPKIPATGGRSGVNCKYLGHVMKPGSRKYLYGLTSGHAQIFLLAANER